MSDGYLVDLPDREHVAIRRLLRLLPDITGDLFQGLGVNPSFAWFLVEVAQDCLVSSMKGDVDIVAGPLQWKDPEELRAFASEEDRWDSNAGRGLRRFLAPRKLAESGGVAWPPTLDRLVGVEVKCAYLSPDAEAVSANALKSKKASWQKVRRLQLQVDGLLQMGFDRAVLLDVIANPPASGAGLEAWLEAGDTARQSLEAMLPILDGRLPADSPVDHWVWPVGAVEGDDESRRGTGAPIRLSSGNENPLLRRDPRARLRRKEMQGRLADMFKTVQAPRGLRVVLTYCKRCRRFHDLNEPCEGD